MPNAHSLTFILLLLLLTNFYKEITYSAKFFCIFFFWGDVNIFQFLDETLKKKFLESPLSHSGRIFTSDEVKQRKKEALLARNLTSHNCLRNKKPLIFFIIMQQPNGWSFSRDLARRTICLMM